MVASHTVSAHDRFLTELLWTFSLSCFLSLCSLLSACQSLPLVVSLLSGTGWRAPGSQWATRSAMPLVLAFLLNDAGPWRCLAWVGARGGRGLVQPPCAPTTPLCGLEDLLSSILTWLWVLWAWKQLLLSVFTDVHTSAGSSPLTQLFEATMVLDVVTLVLEELYDRVFGQVELCWQGVDGLLVWVQSNILDEALQDTQCLQGNLENTKPGFRMDTLIESVMQKTTEPCVRMHHNQSISPDDDPEQLTQNNIWYLSAWSGLLVAPTANSARWTSTCSSCSHVLWPLLVHRGR